MSRQGPAAAGKDSTPSRGIRELSKNSSGPTGPENIGVCVCSNSLNVVGLVLNGPGVPNFDLLDFRGQSDFLRYTIGKGLSVLAGEKFGRSSLRSPEDRVKVYDLRYILVDS